MRFVLPFTGSRGDIQPGVALTLELSARGHEVVFGAPPNLVSWVTAATSFAHGVAVVPFGPDTKELLESELVRTDIKSRNPRRRFAALAELANYGWDGMTSSLSEMAVGADAALTGTLGQEMTFNIAEAHNIPFLALHYCPVRTNGSMSVVPGRALPPAVNRATWRLLESIRWRSMRARENTQRVDLGLAEARTPLSARIAQYGGIEIQAYDGALFPGLEAEWGPNRPFVGFLELPSPTPTFGEDVSPGSPLRDWIEDGKRPVYFGFGSMPVRDPAQLLRTITAACEAGGHRALVSSGWSAIDRRVEPGSVVATVGAVDHAVTFPLCAAAVHHGGAGTTAASVRAGLPTMVCWFSADQPFWGAALERTGAGTAMRFSRLDTRSLIEGIDTLLAPATATDARALGRSMTPPAAAVSAAADLAERAVTRSGG
ncbi:MAG: glycosyltransferase [Rhodococcus sp. (in: high G+C Gram-positive bacteria)]